MFFLAQLVFQGAKGISSQTFFNISSYYLGMFFWNLEPQKKQGFFQKKNRNRFMQKLPGNLLGEIQAVKLKTQLPSFLAKLGRSTTLIGVDERSQWIHWLGGGFEYIWNFHPENWGRFPIWLIFFKGGWWKTTNQEYIYLAMFFLPWKQKGVKFTPDCIPYSWKMKISWRLIWRKTPRFKDWDRLKLAGLHAPETNSKRP